MALSTPDKLKKALDAGRRGGTFYLYGEEEYLKEEATAAIVAAHLDPSTRDFNYDQLRGADVEPETLVSIANTPPMMAEWRVLVVREVQALATNARGRAAIESLIERPIPGLALVLVATLPDKSKAAFYERLKKDAVAVEFPVLGANDLPGYLIERAAERGYELDTKAARGLAAAGADLGALIQEIAKLTDYVGDRKRITIDDVTEIVGIVPRQDRWGWFDMVGDGRFAEARASLHVLFDAGESGVGLVIGLGTHFLRLGIAAAGGERALKEVLPTYQSWLAGKIARQAKRWNATAVEDAIDDLLRADRLLKSASLSDHQVIEELLLRMEQRSARRAA